ncbi:LmbU family transcriptional regulator [Streptomyces spectabilis]|uniref:LmbU family transcriptional regulator n=1 Tax=Streptomyces spectabilis TaxID=68270 RepID=UPI0033F77D8F
MDPGDHASDRLLLSGSALTRRTGLLLPEDFTFSRWQSTGRQLFLIADSSAWWLGDWLIFGRERYPDRYRQAISETGLDYKTLRNYAWVAGKIPFSRRRARLSFQHHAEVAALQPGQQDQWLSLAEQADWTRSDLRRAIRRTLGRTESLEEGETMVSLRTTEERERAWTLAATQAGKSLSEWILEVLNEAASRSVFQRQPPAID